MLRELAYLIYRDIVDIIDNLRDCFRRDDEQHQPKRRID